MNVQKGNLDKQHATYDKHHANQQAANVMIIK